jgi:hypothetical protein
MSQNCPAGQGFCPRDPQLCGVLETVAMGLAAARERRDARMVEDFMVAMEDWRWERRCVER